MVGLLNPIMCIGVDFLYDMTTLILERKEGLLQEAFLLDPQGGESSKQKGPKGEGSLNIEVMGNHDSLRGIDLPSCSWE